MKIYRNIPAVAMLLFAIYFADGLQAQSLPADRYRNVIKTNLTSIFLKNYSLQYERQINSRMSISGAVRFMPQTALPLKSSFKKVLGLDTEEGSSFLNSAKIGNIAFTPEFKYYLADKQEGLYVSAFYRYTRFNTGDLTVEYTEKKKGEKQTIHLSGEMTAHSGGLQLGWQKNFGKRFVADLWIVGPQFGVSHGTVSGESSRILDADEQQLLRQNLEEYKIRYYDQKINVSERGASLELDGPWAGIRTGISIGFRF